MRALIIAAYVGPLPELMGLWQRSAGCNPEIDFLVVNDREVPAQLPPNVRFLTMDLAQMRACFDAVVGFPTALITPYKLNDFKPLFWALAPDIDRYDYWGYCDLDVIFGSLHDLCATSLGHYDMILSEGHLRFMRNDSRTRDAWQHVAQPRGWRDILTDAENFGMDEHHGINRVFSHEDRSWFADPGQIADIHPTFRQFRRSPELDNWDRQAFFWQDGRIYHEWIEGGRYDRRELLYIHLQKRKLTISPACLTAQAFNIDPGGIVPRQMGDDTPARIAERNPWQFPTIDEGRVLLSEVRRRFLRRPRHFVQVDRAAVAAEAG